MWHPSPPIIHDLPEPGWPSPAAAAGARLFAPLAAGRLRLAHRTWVPAMVPWRATDDGLVTDDVLAWYERFARGRPAALVVEATGVRDVPSGPLLRIGHERFVPGLRRLVETVRAASGGHTRLFIQLIDFLRIRKRPERNRFLREFLVLTDRHRALRPGADDAAVREALVALDDTALRALLAEREWEALAFGARERVTDLELPAISALPETLPPLFAAAAGRAEAAGFDGVELHMAHAYTLASFLSALNDRSDGHGGSRAARVRVPLAVLRAVRTAVGDGFVVGVRLLAEECIPGGTRVGDAAWYAVTLAAEGADYLSLSRGGKFEDAKQPKVGWARYPYTGPSGWECMPTVRADALGPFGRALPAAARVRGAVRRAGFTTPVVAAGGIAGFAQAEAALAAGAADVIAAARQSLADPDWWEKARLGRGDEVRRCVFTNYCEGLDQMHRQVTCKRWDRVALDDAGVRLARDGRRRLEAPAWAERPA